MSKMMQARSLDDIAGHFEQMAAFSANQADRAATQKSKSLWRRESSTWMQAAHTLRNTTITGEK